MQDTIEANANGAERADEAPAPFSALGLCDPLLATITALGFEAPTPIQASSIPALLAGRDLIGQAQTGTGKTAAFGLPLLQRVDPNEETTQALVLVPTRELANQAAKALTDFSRQLGPLRILAVYGGQPIVAQLSRLNRGVHIVVGTPGRVMDHLRRGSLSLDTVKMVVLDEADEMLRMGFIDDVTWILEHAPDTENRQTAMFSATLPPPVRSVASRYLEAPTIAEVAPERPAIDSVEQRFCVVPRRNKIDALCRLLETDEGEAALVFARTKVGCGELTDTLVSRGFRAEALHGDMGQPHREAVLYRLRSGRTRIVIATDVAARGLDVDGITHVVNFDVPDSPDTYVHRIGRTGRAGRTGRSTLFLEPQERMKLRSIERYARCRLQESPPPSLYDVAKRRKALFKEAVGATIEENDLSSFRSLVEEIAGEGGPRCRHGGGRDHASGAAGATAVARRGARTRAPPRRTKRARPTGRANDPAAHRHRPQGRCAAPGHRGRHRQRGRRVGPHRGRDRDPRPQHDGRRRRPLRRADHRVPVWHDDPKRPHPHPPCDEGGARRLRPPAAPPARTTQAGRQARRSPRRQAGPRPPQARQEPLRPPTPQALTIP